jgi:N-dimethylarginine dimethylaminohydrolase
MGYGPRSDANAAQAVEEMFAQDVVALELADPRFYHMDTALAPLPGGEVMYLPRAFTAAGKAAIHERVAPNERIEITIEDGCRLAANAVALGNTLIMSGCGRRLRAQLEARGYAVVTTPLSSFLRSGGSAFCLTLRLDRRSVPLSAVAPEAAVA